MDDMRRELGPEFICFKLEDYRDLEAMGQMGCGEPLALHYMISFQIVFAIIFLNLFVAVILEGFDETSKLEDANLSEFYMSQFKMHWLRYDPKATGLILCRDLFPFI